MSIQKTPGGYYFVAGRDGKPGRSFSKVSAAQSYDRELNACACAPPLDDTSEAADYLADVVEAYLQALNDGILYAEMELRRACTAYRAARGSAS